MTTRTPASRTRAHMAAAFARELGFWPRTHSHDPGEARLGKWLDAARRGDLEPGPTAILERVTGAGDWRHTPPRTPPTAASVRVDQIRDLAVWRLRHGRLPRSAPGAQRLERDLAAFTARNPDLAAPRPDEDRPHRPRFLERHAALEQALFEGRTLTEDLRRWLAGVHPEDLAPSALRALDTLTPAWRAPVLRRPAPGARPPARGRPTDEARFKERALALRSFVIRRGHLPRQDSPDAAERAMFAWLATQRHQLAHGARSLTDERIALLDRLVPGWGSPRQLAVEPQGGVVDLTALRDSRGHSAPQCARDHGRLHRPEWLRLAQEAARANDLTWDQWLALRAQVISTFDTRGQGARAVSPRPRAQAPAPGAVGRRPDEGRFRERARELQAFVERHGRLPRTGSVDPDERSAWNWLTAQRRALRRSAPSMDAGRRALLDHLVPGWRPPAREQKTHPPALNTGLAERPAIGVSSGTEC